MNGFSRFLSSPWVRGPKTLYLCLAVAAILSLPTLWMGLLVDDYFHVAVIEKLVPFGDTWNLFTFFPGDPEVFRPEMCIGPFPWFSLPEVKATFFRPLSSLLALADHTVFGRHFAWWHLHSVFWYLSLVLALGLILRRALPGVVGTLALLIFAVDQTHCFPTAWLANRNALIAVSLVLWGLCAHIRWREDGWIWGLPLSVLGYIAGLLGGESALGAFAYVAAYEVFAGRGPLSARAKALLPAAGVGAVYFAIYKAFGYGAFGSGSYIDPIQEPWTYLANAPQRVLSLIEGLLIGIPPDLTVLAPRLNTLFAAAGLAALLLFAAVLKTAWPSLDAPQRSVLRWMIPAALASLLPVAATFPMSRLLLACSVGSSAFMAILLAYAWNRRERSRWFAGFAGFLIVTHLILSPLIWIGQAAGFKAFGDRVVAASLHAEMGEPSAAGRRYIALAGPDPLTSIYTPLIRIVLEKRPFAEGDSWQVLSQAPYAHRVMRTGPNRIELEVVDGSMLGTEFERLFRSPRFPLRVGDIVQVCYMTVTVLGVGSTGPSRIAVEFDRPLEDPSFCFLVWKDGHFARFEPPSEGATVIVPRERGVM